jgi:hypothetical protein
MTLAEFRRVVIRQHEEAAATKEEGNLRFKAGEVEAAEDKYHAAVDMADAVLKVPAIERPVRGRLLNPGENPRVCRRECGGGCMWRLDARLGGVGRGERESERAEALI